MKKKMYTVICVCIGIVFLPLISHGSAPSVQDISLSVFPKVVIQGDPFMVQVNGLTSTSSIRSITFGTLPINAFMYKNKPTMFVGIDLNKKPGAYKLTVTLTNGDVIKQTISVGKRQKLVSALGIPQSLGGNSTSSDDAMVATLISENKTLATIPTSPNILWTQDFTSPLATLFITDPYGYSRQTGVYTIPHKGVDYRASPGTPVMSINSGIVRVVQTYRDYGKMIVIDHGQGVMSFYLHLSQFNVGVGDLVQRGQVIGLSGQTGYVEGPHLHLSIRINGISIDPVKFLALFK